MLEKSGSSREPSTLVSGAARDLMPHSPARPNVASCRRPMPAIDIPSLGTAVLCAVLVAAGYAFATAVASGRGRTHLLPAARNGTYATCALVALAVFLLAYSFQVHDFR